MGQLALVKYLVRTRANGVEHWEFWEKNPEEDGTAKVHANWPTHGDGLFVMCKVEVVVDVAHSSIVNLVLEAASITGVNAVLKKAGRVA